MKRHVALFLLILLTSVAGVALDSPSQTDTPFQSDNMSENVDEGRDIQIENHLDRNVTVHLNVTFNDVPECRNVEPPCGAPTEVVDVLQQDVTVPAQGEVTLSNMVRRIGEYTIAAQLVNGSGEEDTVFDWRVSESHHGALITVTDTGVQTTQAVESGPVPDPEPPADQYTFDTDTGRIVVSKTNAACLASNEDGRVTGERVDDTGERYSIGIGGYVAAATPCSVLVPEVSEQGGRIVVNIRTEPSGEPCTQCVGKLHYRVGGNLEENFTLEIQHEGETQTVIARPQRGGLFAFLSFLINLLSF